MLPTVIANIPADLEVSLSQSRTLSNMTSDLTLDENLLNEFRPNLFATAVFQELAMLSLGC
jgi:hypothetical protein